MPRVSFPTRGLSGLCPEGMTIHEAVRSMGYVIDFACGGHARCGTCCVRVVEGLANLSPIGPDEAAQLKELGLAPPHRLSCQVQVQGDVVVLAAG